MALVLCAPWVVGTVLAGKDAVEIFGLPISASAAPGWGEVTRFAIGPTVRSPIVWALVAGAALPLLIGKGVRLVWAARMWVMALASWVLAYAATHGWTGRFAPSESVVLVPAAIAVAVGIGLGISSFENDLAGMAFGWRQVVSGLALVAVTLGLLPVVAGTTNGRWGLPVTGVEQPLNFLTRTPTPASYRTLWLGDPRALPVGGWSVEPGLSYALTGQDLPDAGDVWTPAGPGPAALVAKAVQLAVTGGTIHLGRLLAAQSVQYIVIVDGLAPSDSGMAESVQAPPPPGLEQALLDQNDLQSVPGALGVQVFRNPEAIPITAERARPVASAGPMVWPGPARCGRVAARAQRPGGPHCGDRGGRPGHRLRRLCPGRELLAHQERSGDPRPHRVRMGPAVSACPGGTRHVVVAALSLRPTGCAPRAVGVGGADAGPSRMARFPGAARAGQGSES